jgi:hypothetical protein
MLKGLCAVLVVSVLATACTRTTRTVVVPSGADNVCVSYGFSPGTAAYDNCVVREAEARRRGRVPPGYAESALVSDSQAACYSYGLVPGTVTYEQCVRTEINARRYR